MSKKKRKPLRISQHTMDLYDRRDAMDAMRNIGISPMAITHSMERSASRSELIACAAMEAGAFLGRGFHVGDILDSIEDKYGKELSGIREVIYEMIKKYETDPHGFGTMSDIDHAIINDIRKSAEEDSANV